MIHALKILFAQGFILFEIGVLLDEDKERVNSSPGGGWGDPVLLSVAAAESWTEMSVICVALEAKENFWLLGFDRCIDEEAALAAAINGSCLR